MNGKPSNLLSNNPSVVLKSMPASSVKNIEVITEPGVKYDAEGIGGDYQYHHGEKQPCRVIRDR